MPIFEIGTAGIQALTPVTFSSAGLYERRDIQRHIRDNVGVIAPDTLVISEEFGDWEDSRRRIDLLCLDREANLVVIELKRSEDGGFMDLQAIRYASMVSTMTFERAVDVYTTNLERLGSEELDARGVLLDFLGWDEPDEEAFAQDVRIVLAAAEFSKELTSSVLWLNDHGLDIRCVRLKPYNLDGRILLDIQQIIPLPEVEEFQVQIREKVRKERASRTDGKDTTRFDIRLKDRVMPAMAKRNAILLVCKNLCTNGVKPADITKLLGRSAHRLWYWVDGTLDAAAFTERATTNSARGGQNYDPRRWFCGTDDLCQADGKTYAFTSQWGGERWLNAMSALQKAYPQFEIEFTPAL